MWEDPIVAEVHQTREKMAAAAGYDIAAFFADIRRRQTKRGVRLIPQKNRTESAADSNGGYGSNAASGSSKAAPAA